MIADALHSTPVRLSEEDRVAFKRDGYITVRKAFSREAAAATAAEVLRLLKDEDGIDAAAPATSRTSVSRRASPIFDEIITPRLTSAFDEVAGKDVWDTSHLATHGNFWVTFPGFHSGAWKPPIGIGRWHIDLGYEFRTEFDLRDGNCAFVTAFLITDSQADGACTLVLPGSHKLIARLLAVAKRPVRRWAMTAFCEGLISRWSLAGDIVQLTGDAGDIVLMHPLLIHSASANTKDSIRIMSNTGLGQKRPRQVDAGQPNRSLVEQSIWEDINDLRDSSVRRVWVRILMALNHGLWKMRYAVHGRLPKMVDVELPAWRAVPERGLRKICLGLSSAIAAAVR